MKKRKKIISNVIKGLVGIASVAIIYFRLKSDFTPNNLQLMSESFFSVLGIFSLILCLALIPVNWGLESWKWKLITDPIEKITYRNAQKSVYSGVCLGNLAPGRATEFLAKIFFFHPENRANVTVLHFVNGMFQLSVTYLIGFTAMAFKLNSFGDTYIWIAWATGGIALAVLALFIVSIIKIDKVLHFVTKKISKKHEAGNFSYKFTAPLLSHLFGWSFVRFFIFFTQMLLIVNLFSKGSFTFSIGLSVALYFLITTTIPMISILEPAIRAAIALVVFKDTGVSNAAIALASVCIWLFNIIFPSILGYYFLLQQNFDFNLRRSKT